MNFLFEMAEDDPGLKTTTDAPRRLRRCGARSVGPQLRPWRCTSLDGRMQAHRAGRAAGQALRGAPKRKLRLANWSLTSRGAWRHCRHCSTHDRSRLLYRLQAGHCIFALRSSIFEADARFHYLLCHHRGVASPVPSPTGLGFDSRSRADFSERAFDVRRLLLGRCQEKGS